MASCANVNNNEEGRKGRNLHEKTAIGLKRSWCINRPFVLVTASNFSGNIPLSPNVCLSHNCITDGNPIRKILSSNKYQYKSYISRLTLFYVMKEIRDKLDFLRQKLVYTSDCFFVFLFMFSFSLLNSEN